MKEWKAVRKSGDIYDLFYDGPDFDLEVSLAYIRRAAQEADARVWIDQSGYHGEGEEPGYWL